MSGSSNPRQRKIIPDNIYLFKVNNRNTRKRREICLKLSIKVQSVYC